MFGLAFVAQKRTEDEAEPAEESPHGISHLFKRDERPTVRISIRRLIDGVFDYIGFKPAIGNKRTAEVIRA